MNTIRVGNTAQKILFECELKGQLSDGHWENAVPHDHWQVPCAAKVVVANEGETAGITWYRKKAYAFDSKQLLDVVGPRMIYWVKFYSAFPQLSLDSHWSFDLSDGWPEYRGEYWDKKRAGVLSATGCANYAEIMAKVNAEQYTEKDLVRDLRFLKSVFSNHITIEE